MGNRLFRIFFYGTTSVLYAAFLFLDIRGDYDLSMYVKYTSIAVCLAAALYVSISQKTLLIAVTASLTLFADTFLLLINDYYIAGVTAFAIVQTLFGLYIEKMCCIKYLFLSRIIIYLIITAFLILLSCTDDVSVVSAWSYVNLVLNTLQLTLLLYTQFHGKLRLRAEQASCRELHDCTERQSHNRAAGAIFHPDIDIQHLILLTAGMWLFFGCDTCVGLTNLHSYIPGALTGSMHSMVSYFMWVFYLPSQVIMISSFMYRHYHYRT